MCSVCCTCQDTAGTRAGVWRRQAIRLEAGSRRFGFFRFVACIECRQDIPQRKPSKANGMQRRWQVAMATCSQVGHFFGPPIWPEFRRNNPSGRPSPPEPDWQSSSKDGWTSVINSCDGAIIENRQRLGASIDAHGVKHAANFAVVGS